MADLKTAAKDLVRALSITGKAIDVYFATALAVGRESKDPTERGFDARQLRRRIHAEVVARLSPKPIFGMPAPVLELDGAPQARRFITTNPLPGLT